MSPDCRASIDLLKQAERVALQLGLPGAVGHEVELIQRDSPDQSVSAPRFDDCGEGARAAQDLDLDVADNGLGPPAIMSECHMSLPLQRHSGILPTSI